MKIATAVIGANYGDEGKGIVTDYLASRLVGDKVIVRFNGGAQAGHTVVSPERKRHVFSHFGAGCFSEASTYLAKHFVCNPILFWTEVKQLMTVGIENPKVIIDPRCYITTPYDMMINQIKEENRGKERHGSVGFGFGETIERNIYPSFQLWRSDLHDRKRVEEKVKLIRDKWIPARFRQLKLSPLDRGDCRLSDTVMNTFIEECISFASATQIAGAEYLRGKSVIFEGAQGLALDMDRGNFPHVTRSNTGLKNCIPIVKAIGMQLEVIYVSRTYLTKHGAGPLTGEYTPVPPIVDETNKPHDFQGNLRFGHLDIAAMQKRIDIDEEWCPGIKSRIALTCFDQVSDFHSLKPCFVSNGPKRSDVQPR